MAVPKRKAEFLGLRDIDVFINDSTPTSDYFNVYEVPEILTQGKSSFLIGGTDDLKPGIDIKIELIKNDSDDIIYLQPVMGHNEGGLRRVSIEVYDDTPPGVYTLYIVGELNPNKTNVPQEWQGTYNVRWSKRITVNVMGVNTQTILFYKQPTINVTEQFKEFVISPSGSSTEVYLTGSGEPAQGFTTPEVPTQNFTEGGYGEYTYPNIDFKNKAKLGIIEENKPLTKLSGKKGHIGSQGKQVQTMSPVPNDYLISLSGDSTVNSLYVGQSFTLNNPQVDTSKFTMEDYYTLPAVYTSSIMKVINNKTFVPKDVFYVQDTRTTPSTLIPAPFVSTYPITASFYDLPSQTTSSINFQSFADITVQDMKTFSGDVHKVKIYAKNEGSLGDFELIYDSPIESTQVLYDKQETTTQTNMGYFLDTTRVTNYWEIYHGNEGNTSGTLTYDATYVNDSMKISGSNMEYGHSLRVQNKTAVDFIAGTLYNFRAKVYGIKKNKKDIDGNISSAASFKVMAYGDAFNKEETTAAHWGDEKLSLPDMPDAVSEYDFGIVEGSFLADNTATGYLQFQADSGEWYISDIELKTATDTAFNPDYVKLTTPIPPLAERPSDVRFLVEFYDVNNNIADSIIFSEPITFQGPNINISGTDNILSGSMYIGNSIGGGVEMAGVNSAFIRSMGYRGFKSGSGFGNNAGTGEYSGFMFYSGSVLPDSGDDYQGVGLELVGDSGSYFKFATNPSELDIRTDAFFIGQESIQFMSGSDSNIEISSSLFWLDPKNDRLIIGADATINADLSVNNIFSPAGTNINTAKAAITSEGYAKFVSASIGAFKLNDDSLFSGPNDRPNFFISGSATGTDYFISSSNFQVRASGEVSASSLKLSGGDVGGLTVSDGQVSVGEILKLKDSGQITGSAVLLGDKSTSNYLQYVNNTLTVRGDITVDSITTPATIAGAPSTAANASASITSEGLATFKSGSIAGWKIFGNKLSGSNATLDADGAALYHSSKGPGSDTAAAFDQLRDEYYIDFTPSQGATATAGKYYVKFGPNFSVSESGVLFASGAVFEGQITASTGQIGGADIESASLAYSPYWRISSSADTSDPVSFISSSRFKVSAGGKITGSQVLFTGGTIGGFELSSTQINDTSDNLILKSSGHITGSKVLFTGGKIAGWDINSTYISKAISGSAAYSDYTRVFMSSVNDNTQNITEGFTVYRKDEDIDNGAVKVVRLGGLSDTTNLHANNDYGLQVLQKDSNNNYSNLLYIGSGSQTLSGWNISTSGFVDSTGAIQLSSTQASMSLGTSGEVLIRGNSNSPYIALQPAVALASKNYAESGIFLGVQSGTTPKFSVVGTGGHIKFDGTDLDITADKVHFSGSQITLKTPDFYLGDLNNYISGSGGNLAIYSTGDTTLSGSSVTIATPSFFMGATGSAFISGSNGNLVLSSSKFFVDQDGDVTGSSVLFTGGRIAQWTIDGHLLKSAGDGGIRLNGNPGGAEISVGTHTYGNGPGIQLHYNSGNPQFFAGAGASNYLKYTVAGGVDIKTEVFKLDTDHLDIDSGTNDGKIALGTTPPTAYNSGNGIYVDGTGKALIGSSTGSMIQFDGTNLILSSSVFLLGDSGSAYVSGSNSNIEISSSNFYLKADGTLNMGAGDFTIDTSGNVTMAGSVTATTGTIGGFHIGSNALWGGNAAIDNAATQIVFSGIQDGDTPKFAMGNTADDITLVGGTGLYVDGDGDFKIGSPTKYLKYTVSGDALEVKAGTLEIDATNLEISSTQKSMSFGHDSGNGSIEIIGGGTSQILMGTGNGQITMSANASDAFIQFGNKTNFGQTTTHGAILGSDNGNIKFDLTSGSNNDNYFRFDGSDGGGLDIKTTEFVLDTTNLDINSSTKRIEVSDGSATRVRIGEVDSTAASHYGITIYDGTGTAASDEIVHLSDAKYQIASWSLSPTQITSQNLVIDSAGILQTADFASGVQGWRITSANNGEAEFEKVTVRGTLSTTVFEKESVNAVGGQLYVANSTIISQSSQLSATATTMSVANVGGFVADEIISAKKVSDTGFSTEYMLIESASRDEPSSDKNFAGKLYLVRGYSGSQPGTNDTGSLGDAASTATTYENGQVIVSTGKIGTGYIRLNANPNDSTTPYIDIVERTGSAIYDVSLKARLGDLSGLSSGLLYGETSPGFGLFTENVFLQGAITATTGSFTGAVWINTDSSNRMALGSNVNSAFDGVYVNNNNFWYTTGDFRAGDDNNFIYASGSTITLKSDELGVATNTFIVSSSLNSGTVKMGSSVTGITSTANTGIYMDGTGKFRVGEDQGSGDNFIYFDGSTIQMKSTNFDLVAGSTLLINSSTPKIALGSSVTAQSLTAGTGIFMNGSGHFKAGTAGAGRIEWDGTHLTISSSDFFMGGTTNYISGSNGSIKVSGSSVDISTPAFFMGATGSSYVSGSNSNLEISSSQFFLKSDGSLNIGAGNITTSTSGDVTMTGTVTANAGAIGGFTIDDDEIKSGTTLILDSNSSNGQIKLGAATALDTGDGIYMDGDGNFRVGSVEGYGIRWDTQALRVSSSEFYLGDATNFISGSGGAISIGADTFDLNTTNLRVSSSAGGTIAMGSTLPKDLSSNGIMFSGSGDFNLQGDANNYLRRVGTDLTIKAGTFDLDVTGSNGGLVINSAANSGKIAVGNPPPTSVASTRGPGVYMDGTGDFLVRADADNYIKMYSNNIDIKSEVFDLDAGSLIMDSAGDGGTGTFRLGGSGGPSTPTANVAGIYMDGGGALNVYGDASNYLRIDGSTIDMRTTTFYLSGSDITLKSPDFYLGDTSNYISGSGGAIDIAADTFDLNTTNLRVSSSKGGTIAMGKTIPKSISGSGVFLSGSGDFLAGNHAGNKIQFNPAASAVVMKSDVFNLDATTIVIDSSANNGKIALGASPNSSVTGTNKGIYMDGQGDFLAYGDAKNYIKFDASATSIDMKSDTFGLGTATMVISSSVNNGTIRLGSGGGPIAHNTDAAGIYMDGQGRFQVYGNSTNYLRWDGSDLTVKGDLTVDNIMTPSTIGGSSSTILNASASITAQGFALFKSASIGGFHVSDSQINDTDSNLVLKSNGQISASAIQATGGTVGGWELSANQLSANNIKINAASGYIEAGGLANVSDISDTSVGFFANKDGEVLIKAGTSANKNYMQFKDGTLDINTDKAHISGSSITLKAPDFYLGDASNYISGSGGNLAIYSTGNTTLSGSSVNIQTPSFYLGESAQYISGSGGNLEISSSGFHLDRNGNTAIQGKVTADEGEVGGFTIEDSQLRGTLGGTPALTLDSGLSARMNYDGNDATGIVFGTDNQIDFSEGVFTGSAWVMSDVGGSSEALFFRAGVKNTYFKLTSQDSDDTGILEISASNFNLTSQGNLTASNARFETVTIRGGTGRNVVTDDSYHSFMGGGDAVSIEGRSFSSVIGAGAHNTISGSSDFSALLSGISSSIHSDSDKSAIITGEANTIASSSNNSLIGTGINHEILYGSGSVIISGRMNKIIGDPLTISTAGGPFSAFFASDNFIGTGFNNKIYNGSNASIICGYNNTISGSRMLNGAGTSAVDRAFLTTIAGGNNNKVKGEVYLSTILGGASNTITQPNTNQYMSIAYGAILGGTNNHIVSNALTNWNSSIVQGSGNYIQDSSYSFIGTGQANKIMSGSQYSTIVGGNSNKIGKSTDDATYAFIGNGNANEITGDEGDYCSILNGSSNEITSTKDYNTILGGTGNIIEGTSGNGRNTIVGGASNTIPTGINDTFIIGSAINATAAGGSIADYTTYTNNLHIVDGSIGVECVPNTTDGHIRASNDIVAFYSDERLKEKIDIGIKNPIEKIMNINVFTYKHNKLANSLGFEGDKIYIGVGAKSVKEVVPEAVEIAPFDVDGDGNSKSGEDYLTVQYERLVPLLIEGIKNQQVQIDELKQEIKEIKNGNSS